MPGTAAHDDGTVSHGTVDRGKKSRQRLGLVFGITVAFMVVEVVGGIVSGSFSEYFGGATYKLVSR